MSRTRVVKWFGILLAILIVFDRAGSAQTAPPLAPDSRISLLTISPGDELYSTFGHSAIRVVDERRGLDRLYNYGTFDFEEEGFYLKFCRGRLDYFLSAYPFHYALEMYTEEHRAIVEQVLNLTPEMKNAVFQFLEWNYLPENRGYRYDFFFDNCATRIRDAFESTLTGSLQLYLHSRKRYTFRQEIALYLGNHPFSRFGMDLGLGARADRFATAREEMFLPDFLMEAIGKSTITIDGTPQALVASTDTLLWFDEAFTPRSSRPWPQIILWAFFGLLTFFTWGEFRSYRHALAAGKIVDRILYASTGLLGLIVLLLWVATDHRVTPENWNLLWAWPTHLLLVLFLGWGRLPRLQNYYLLVYSAATAVTLLGWSFWPQQLHPAVIPLVLSLFLRSVWRVRQSLRGSR